ncbi:right-handed parallel beta-helix repeat-containing protein [Kitasatospora gansuensis]
MHHRRIVATAAALAAGFAFLPGQAYAADPAPNAVQAPARSGWELPGAKTFTSPAGNSSRVQGEAAVAARSAAVPSTGRTIYVVTRTTCTSTGTGTQAAPFCSLQRGVDAAVPGDTVQVDGKDEGASPPSAMEAVVVRTSGLTLLAGTNAPRMMSFNDAAGKPALTLDGVSDVTISHLTFSGGNAPGLLIKGSSRITLDSDQLTGSGGNALAIDGTSSTITLTRSNVGMSWPVIGSSTISVAAGAKDVTLVGNLVQGATTDNSQTQYQATGGIAATGVQGLNVVGNTIQRGCLPAIAVDGASTAVSIQNNVLVETAAVADCDSGQPAVTVSAESAPATTTDYNDFYAESATGAGPYRWAGTAYPTVAAFKAAQSQGAHDTVETVAPQRVNGSIAYALQTGSAAIGTANQSAPGALTTDYFGHGPMTDRGAVKFQSNNPGFAMALTAKNTSAYGVSLDLDVTTLPVAQDIYIQWGDDSTDVLNFYGNKPVKTTAYHVYKKLGDYTITVTDYEKTGNTIRNTVKVSTFGSQYTAYGPKRLLDSRDGTGLPAAAGSRRRGRSSSRSAVPTASRRTRPPRC